MAFKSMRACHVMQVGHASETYIRLVINLLYVSTKNPGIEQRKRDGYTQQTI